MPRCKGWSYLSASEKKLNCGKCGHSLALHTDTGCHARSYTNESCECAAPVSVQRLQVLKEDQQSRKTLYRLHH